MISESFPSFCRCQSSPMFSHRSMRIPTHILIDLDRQYLVHFIADSSAGFTVRDVKLTREVFLKQVYIFVAMVSGETWSNPGKKMWKHLQLGYIRCRRIYMCDIYIYVILYIYKYLPPSCILFLSMLHPISQCFYTWLLITDDPWDFYIWGDEVSSMSSAPSSTDLGYFGIFTGSTMMVLMASYLLVN